LDKLHKAKIRELKANDAQRKVEKAREMEELKMRDIANKLIEKEKKSEEIKQNNINEKINKSKIREVKMDKAKKSIAENENKIQK